MTVKILRGDIFASTADALIIPVNCEGVMGAGLARTARFKLPNASGQYGLACKTGKVRLGRMFLAREGKRWIVFFPTKGSWRHKSMISSVQSGLGALVVEARLYGIKTIACPALGCGCGGLAWPDVKKLVEKTCGPASAQVHVDLYEPFFN